MSQVPENYTQVLLEEIRSQYQQALITLHEILKTQDATLAILDKTLARA